MILTMIVTAIWGCVPELANDCLDMTNSSSTYFSIVIGAIFGSIISWWIYNRQKKTSEVQDTTLKRIQDIDNRHEHMLKRIQQVEKHHQDTLDAMLKLEKRIAELLENQKDNSS